MRNLIFNGRASVLRNSEHIGKAGTPSGSMVRLISLLAGLAAVTIAAIVPVSWFLVAEARLHGELEFHTQLYASQVAEEARQNPALWNALAGSEVRPNLEAMSIAQPPDAAGADAERRRVLSGTGQVIVEAATAIAPGWPLLVERTAVLDGTAHLGDVEIASSLHPALLVSGAVAAVSICFGMCLFVLLRVLPLRQLDAAIRHASFLSGHDLLTGLPNRRVFYDRLEQALASARRERGRVAVFCIDLDHFKAINDLLGHAAGDATLQTVATWLSGCLRGGDTLARLGGDEFAVIQPGLRRPEDASNLAARLIQAMGPPVDLGGHPRPIGLSIGVAVSKASAPCRQEELIKQADVALYQAKKEGRNRVSFYSDEMNEVIRYRYEMEADLRDAVAQGQLGVLSAPGGPGNRADARRGSPAALEPPGSWPAGPRQLHRPGGEHRPDRADRPVGPA